jgi:hypothetical protein
MAEAASPQVDAARPGPRPLMVSLAPSLSLFPLLAPWVFWLRGFSGKIGFLQYFPGLFLKVGFLHKNKTPGQFC